MDEGIRYDRRPPSAAAGIDASSHLYLCYEHAGRWSRKLGQPASEWEAKAADSKEFIRSRLWDAESGFFYDAWTIQAVDQRHLAFEGMWPVVVGAATAEQATRLIDEHLLNAKEFFSPHPLSTVAMSDPKFELRMWRGRPGIA